jgi:hypothetical protein
MVRPVLSFPCVGHIVVACTLLIVASAPRSARAQASEGAVLQTVRHTVRAELGTVMRAQWRPFEREATGAASRRWIASGRVASNVPVVAIAEVEGAAELVGWRLRDPDGRLVPWDGRATVVSAPLGPGATEVEVELLSPVGAGEMRPPVRLRVAAADAPR